MPTSKRKVKICSKGHHFFKSSNCLTCPICEKLAKTVSGFLSTISAPARRALENAGITTVKKLATYSEKDLLKLHGIGKASIPTLRTALSEKGLSFKK